MAQLLVRLDAGDKPMLDRLCKKTGHSIPRVLHDALKRYGQKLFFDAMNATCEHGKSVLHCEDCVVKVTGDNK